MSRISVDRPGSGGWQGSGYGNPATRRPQGSRTPDGVEYVVIPRGFDGAVNPQIVRCATPAEARRVGAAFFDRDDVATVECKEAHR